MFCNKCGEEIPDGAKFCPNCGNTTNKKQTIEEEKSNLNSKKTESDIKKVSVDSKSSADNAKQTASGFIKNWKSWSTTKKVISVIVCCCIGWLIISAITSVIIPDQNTFADDSDSNSFSGGEIKLIKTSTSGYDSKSDGKITYSYWVEGVVKNLPDKGVGYDLKGAFYDDNGELVQEKDNYLDLDYCYDDFQKSEPELLVALNSNQLLNIRDVEITVYDPDGEIVLNETVPFKMQNMDLNYS